MTNFGKTKKANHNNNKTKKANIKNPCQGRKSNPGPSAPQSDTLPLDHRSN